MFKVLKAFDNYTVGQIMVTADVADQKRRGNLQDLVKNGFVAEQKARAKSTPKVQKSRGK